MFAIAGAAVTAATAKLSSDAETSGSAAKCFLTTMLTVPPSTAPSMIGRNAQLSSSRA